MHCLQSVYKNFGDTLMRTKKAVITLTASEVQEVLRIAMDNEEQKALRFIKETLCKRVKEAIESR